jgi:hypothetical protein
MFVSEVYRGTPQEVRVMAQSVLAEQFTAGSVIAMQMLDQFMNAPSSSDIGQCIERYTGQVVPPVRVPSYEREARLALVRHALALQPLGVSSVDAAEALLVDSFIGRSRNISRTPLPAILPDEAIGASALLRDAWQRLAAMLISTHPTPDDLAGLARRHDVRRHLAQGPVQQFVAAQVAILELHAYVTTAERPAVRSAVAEMLRVSALTRDSAASVLDQSLEAESATAELWRLRMGGEPSIQETGQEVNQ